MLVSVTLSFLLLVCSDVVRGQREATQDPYAICLKNLDSNTLAMEFRLGLNSDPQGVMLAYDSSSNEASCVFDTTGSGSEKVWYSTSVLTLDSSTALDNGCGFEIGVAGGSGSLSYTWRFLYHERPDRMDIDAGLNRMYTIVCDPSTITENMVEASITVSSPNLDQTVVPYVPVISLNVLREVSPGTGNYVNVAAGDQLIVDTLLKLRLSLRYGEFDSNKYYGVSGLRTLFSPDASFNSASVIEFLDTNGCKGVSVAPDDGFKRTSNGANGASGAKTYVQETGAFPLFQFDGSNSIFIKVTYTMCHGSSGFDQNPVCIDPCAALSSKRRRRQEEDHAEKWNTTFVIHVYDPSQENEEQIPHSKKSTSDKGVQILLVSAIAVAGVVLLALLAFIVYVIKSRDTRVPREMLPPHSFDYKAQIPK